MCNAEVAVNGNVFFFFLFFFFFVVGELSIHYKIAMKGNVLPARALVETGATYFYISEQYLATTSLPVCEQTKWLSLANGSKANSRGKVVIPLDIQSYQGAVEWTVRGPKWTSLVSIS